MYGPPYKPTQAFAYERELAGCSRASLILCLPASAIPPEWLEDPRSPEEKQQLAEDELAALNGKPA